MMKKEFNDQKYSKMILQRGEAWIRRNTRQDRMVRIDFEKIYEKRMKNKGFSGNVQLLFSDVNSANLTLRPLDEMLLPSKRNYENISKIIENKKQMEMVSSSSKKYLVIFKNILRQILSPDRKYWKMDLNELISIQNKILDEYSEDDYAQIFGIWANRINIVIENLGNEYIEDASIKFIFPTDGLAISNQEENIRNRHPYPKLILPSPWKYYLKQIRGFNAVYGYSEFEFTVDIGDIKHKMPKKIFKEPLKISLNKSLKGKTLTIKCNIYGKNLREPIYRELTLECEN
jgi:hypothetical protein